MNTRASDFLKPTLPLHRQYEVLRAIFVEGLTVPEAAERFGYSPGAVYNLCAHFRQNPQLERFFQRSVPGRKPKPEEPLRVKRTRRILALRKHEKLSVTEIRERLLSEGMRVGTSTISKTLQDAGIPKLPRRTAQQRAALRVERAPPANCAALDLSPRRFRTRFGGLFLFAHDLVRMDLDSVLAACTFPGSDRIPAGCAVRSLLALKLWGIGRPRHFMPDILDEGPALFSGLNIMPKTSTLVEYSARVDPRVLPQLMTKWHHAVEGVGIDLGGGRSFDLDFHTIPYHGDHEVYEKHYISKRSRRQKGMLALLARDADGCFFTYANVQIRKADQYDQVLAFVEHWEQRTGNVPSELVFDSGLTTYANLARLHASGIRFLTLRRRSQSLVSRILATPQEHWRRVRLTNIGRAYRNPRVLEQTVRLRNFPGEVRQIAIIDLGHEKPTLLITNEMKGSAAKLIDRYARRMIIENTIADAIDFFHMDALSAAAPLKIGLDVQLTLMASSLYRLLARRISHGYEKRKTRTLFRDLVNYPGTVHITSDEIIVTLGRRANGAALRSTGYHDSTLRVPWLHNRPLTIRLA